MHISIEPKTILDRQAPSTHHGNRHPHLRLRLGSLLLCALLASSVMVALLPKSSTGAPDTWTFMVYLNADNDLEDHGIADFLEMATVDNATNLNIVVQFDRYAGGASYQDDISYGNWTDSKRFVVTKGMEPTAANATMDLGEVDMADWNTLVDFVNWTVTNYPATHYALDIWDHGGDWYGVSWDYTSGTMMQLSGLTSALWDLQSYRPSLMYDIIAFDECGMGSVEIAYELTGYADYLLASEIRVPEDGFNYSSLQAIVDTPNIQTTDLTARFMTDYSDYYYSLIGTPKEYMLNDSFTLSTVDLNLIDPLVAAIDVLSLDMIDNIDAWWDQIYMARNLTEDYSGLWGDDVVDIYHLGEQLGSALSFSPDAQSNISSVMDAFNASVVSEIHGTNPGNTTEPVDHTKGLSIYFPGVDAYFDELYLSIGNWFQFSTHWDEFLDMAYIGRPYVAAWEPNGDAVPTDTVIVAWVSEPIVPLPNSMQLYRTGDYPNFIPCNFSYNATALTLELRPKSPLLPGVNYTVQTTLYDMQGNQGGFYWQFTTEGVAIPEFPSIGLPVLLMVIILLASIGLMRRRAR